MESNQTSVLDNTTTTSNVSGVEAELPPDMKFNSAHVISIVGYGTLFLVSSVANITVLRILVNRYRKTKSRVNLLLIHLAIADLIVTFLMMPLEIGWAATVMWLAGDFLCRFFSFFRIFGLFLSSNILICISLDRFYAIVCPLSTGKATRNMKILLLSSWILSILCASPQAYIFHVAKHPDFSWYTQCVTFGSFPSPVWEDAYIIFGMVMIYFLPLVVIVLTYSVILFTIYKKSRAADSDNGDGLRRSGAGVLNRARARTLKMTVVIVLVFILCWTPYYIISLWFFVDKDSFYTIDQRIQRSLYIFACTNSVMDPIVYGFFNLRKNKTGRNQLQMTRGAGIAAEATTTNIMSSNLDRRTTTTTNSRTAGYTTTTGSSPQPSPDINVVVRFNVTQVYMIIPFPISRP